jgi:hypothetical protein
MRDQLERELRELDVVWPQTPDIAAAVAERLTVAPAPRARRVWRPSWPAWQVAVAVGAALIAVVMAVPPARSAILEWFGFSTVRIERAEPPSRLGSEPRSPLGADLQLGEPVTLAQARERADFDLVVPEALGEPDAVYVSSDPAGRARVDFLYRPRPGLPRTGTTGVGLLVTQFSGSAGVMIEKTVGEGTTVERLRVGGDPAFFLSGENHGFAYSGEQEAGFEPARLAGDTLLVDRADGVLLRLESELSRDAAVRIAETAG